tara:strand:+ start:216 stop:764 length:549 start_codon:yes stop_codon:yes gene_type:complete
MNGTHKFLYFCSANNDSITYPLERLLSIDMGEAHTAAANATMNFNFRASLPLTNRVAAQQAIPARVCTVVEAQDEPANPDAANDNVDSAFSMAQVAAIAAPTPEEKWDRVEIKIPKDALVSHKTVIEATIDAINGHPHVTGFINIADDVKAKYCWNRAMPNGAHMTDASLSGVAVTIDRSDA